MNLQEGSLLQGGRYRIEKVLGQGGFGITYSGYQTNLEAKVAIKEFFMKDLCNRDATTSQVSVGSVGSRETVETFRQKFLKEARNIFRLKHKHIISVIDVFEENGTAYYVMEHVGGGSLAGKVLHGALPEEDAVRYTRQVADALAFVHSKRMMHLDVKPANILLDDNDNAVLIDFGLAKQYDTEGHQTSSTPVGISHGYAPLEQYKRGGVSTFSPATDIYSLGATLFKLVTGITPPEASDVNDEGLPVLPSDISAPVRRAIEAAMQPRRKDRPQSVAEFLNLLESTDNRVQSTDNREQSTDNREQGEDLIDDSDVEVTVLPDKRAQRTDNRVQRVNAKALEAESEEDRSVVNSTSRSNKGSNESSWLKGSFALFFVLTLAIFAVVLIVSNKATDFNIGENEYERANAARLAEIRAADERRIIEEQDSLFYEREEARLAEQQAREEAARREREEQARREREEAERLAREQQQGISTQKKVDLGLSVCWAAWNVGASSPEGYGNYYAWGETTTKSSYTDDNSSTYGKPMGSIAGNSTYDVARAQWGGSWRLPTEAEFEELKNRCTWTWTSYNGINGYKVTGPNGNSIFLPAAGYRYGTELDYGGSRGCYWSGSLDEGNQSYYAYSLYFNSGDRYVGYSYREYGHSVRPVCDK